MTRDELRAGLEHRIGYAFRDQALLERALTHVSAVAGERFRGDTYQRLEFLGDRVLGLVVADLLFRAHPEADEGELSRRLAALVRKETCAEVALALGQGEAIRLGEGEAQSGGRRKGAILGDACEGLIGAVFLDGGFAEAYGFVERFWGARMREPAAPQRDAKTALQEWAQGRGLAAPVYREVGRSGPDHRPSFRVAVAVESLAEAVGVGRSKRMAEQAAAEQVLIREGVWNGGRDG